MCSAKATSAAVKASGCLVWAYQTRDLSRKSRQRSRFVIGHLFVAYAVHGSCHCARKRECRDLGCRWRRPWVGSLTRRWLIVHSLVRITQRYAGFMRLGFVGLGNMGTGMARNLLRAGHQVTVYNRTRQKADALAADGARVASSPAEACRDAEAVLTMLADDAAVEHVVFGENGILGALAN